MTIKSITFDHISDFGERTEFEFFFPIKLIAGPDDDGWYKIHPKLTIIRDYSSNIPYDTQFYEGELINNSEQLLNLIK